jgi:hypothetical protein
MEESIPVGSSHREWWFIVLVGVAVCLMLGGGMMLLAQTEGGLPVLIAGGVCAIAAALSAVSIASRKLSVRITPDGFIVHDRHGEHEFTDDQVICASLHHRSNYTNGELKGTTRTFDLWVENETGAGRLKMINRFPLGAVDPLELLIERVLGHLYDRANDALAARAPFEGEGWTLHPNELVVSQRPRVQGVRLEEIAAAEVFDNEVCVWKKGNDMPAVRIPIRSANAQVLLRLLRDRTSETASEGVSPTGDQLGRILFERRPSRVMVALAWIIPGIMLLVGLAGVAGAIFGRRGNPGTVLFSSAAVMLVLGIFWLLPLSQCVTLRCHEHGLCRRWLWREQRLKYSQVETFAYNAVRQYVKGVYSGTSFTLSFTLKPGLKPATLEYTRSLRNADDELEHLRDHVSRLIAARMAEAFARGEPVKWTQGLRLLKEGLEYRASGFLGRKPPVVLRYDQITGMAANAGVFHVWVAGQKKPAVKEKVSQPNFFAGQILLARIFASRPAAARTEASAGS